MNLNVLYSPKSHHLNEIREWLQKEDRSFNEGFFCQMDIIENSFQKNRLIVVTKDDVAVGFLTFYFSDYIVNIEIAEVKPSERKKGIGKFLLQGSFDGFIEDGVFVAQLFCAPASSEKIWKRMGFNNFPNGIIREPRIYLYKILVETTELYIQEEVAELIELWDSEDYGNEIPSMWRWEIVRQEKSNKLVKPIIHPCSDKWSVAHRIGSETFANNSFRYVFLSCTFSFNGGCSGFTPSFQQKDDKNQYCGN